MKRVVYESVHLDFKIVGLPTPDLDTGFNHTHCIYQVVSPWLSESVVVNYYLHSKKVGPGPRSVHAIALLAMLIDHLYREHLDNQPREIALVLTHLEQALLWYQESTNKTSPRYSS